MIEFKEVVVKEVREFIEKWHYSKSINGCKVSKCYAAYLNGEIVGAALYGELSTTAWKKYAENEKDVVELRRLVTTEKTKKFSKQISILADQTIKENKL